MKKPCVIWWCCALAEEGEIYCTPHKDNPKLKPELKHEGRRRRGRQRKVVPTDRDRRLPWRENE